MIFSKDDDTRIRARRVVAVDVFGQGGASTDRPSISANLLPMATQIAPMLAVSNGPDAVDFYKKAFGATVLWLLEGGHVAGLAIEGAQFFLADESPPHGTRSPKSAGFTTVRIELFVDDPVALHKRAVAEGATERNPVEEYSYETTGPRPIGRMLQGSVVDLFGHIWLIGKFLD